MSLLTFLLGGGALGIAALAGAYVSVRSLRTNNEKVVAQTRSIVAQDQDKLLDRYRKIVGDQDEELRRCNVRIDELEKREADCEARARKLARELTDMRERVLHVQEVLRRHGLNGDD